MEVVVKYLRPHPKTGILEYRRVIPEPLRPHVRDVVGKPLSELKRSLGARDVTEPGAMARYDALQAEFERMIVRARKLAAGKFDPLDAPTIAYLVEAYRVRELADDDARRLDPDAKARGELVTAAAQRAGYDIPPHRPTARWSQGIKVAIEAALDVYRGFSADGDLDGILDAWNSRAASLAGSNGLHVDIAGPAFATLCVRLPYAILRQKIGVDRAERGRWLELQVLSRVQEALRPPAPQ